jgi:serine/threonine protein kinase/Tol biopolymer transport system component
MSLSVGTRLGPYEVTGAIGAGGMGEVYRATDTKLGREVAIKALPGTLASDSDRLARFDREARLLAALNHPNIAVIYGLEEHDGTQCIAMELIEGETLEDKLKAGPLPVEDALQIALQITLGLEAAHEKGVVHRDLKPANVMITAKGQVKVLDFGLAKAFTEDADEAGLGKSPALSLAMTQQGIILGTAGYMSPEQASGQATDQRADVWAFGVVLFEMLSGLPLFKGESVPHILADILKTEPDWNKLPKNLHPRLKLMLERCLAKKPRNRYHAIADARIDIEAVMSDSDASWPQSGSSRVASVSSGLPKVAAAVVVTAVVAALAGWWFWPRAEPAVQNRFDYDLPDGHVLTSGDRRFLTVSPDGRSFAYNTEDGIYVRPMGELEARLVLQATQDDLLSPTFSPNGQWIAFQERNGPLRRVSITGGQPVVIADLQSNTSGLSWAADGMLYFGQPNGLYRVSATGGTPEQIVEDPTTDTWSSEPQLLPDGDSLLYTHSTANWDTGQIVVESLSTGNRQVLIEGGSDGRYLPTGHLLYSIGNGLFAVAFDLETWTVSGGAVPLLQGVMRAPTGNTGTTNYGVARDGTLVYLVGTSTEPQRTLVWVDRSGRETAVSAPPRAYTYPRLSPDGTRLALDVRDQELDIWLWDLAREQLSRFTFSPDQDEFPVWSPDGRQLVFSSAGGIIGTAGGSRVSRQAADGTGRPEVIAEKDTQLYSASYHPDGTGIFVRSGLNSNDAIGLIRLDDENREELLIDSSFDELNPEISPDGRWLAYTSNESGTFEIYVRPFPDIDGGRWQVSSGGGRFPAWARDGQELFYRNGAALMAVTVETEPNFSSGNPMLLFEGDYFDGVGGRTYEVSIDGERFLMIKDMINASSTAQIIIVQKWLDEVARLAPTEN